MPRLRRARQPPPRRPAPARANSSRTRTRPTKRVKARRGRPRRMLARSRRSHSAGSVAGEGSDRPAPFFCWAAGRGLCSDIVGTEATCHEFERKPQAA
ncbi:MAG: hypothetical protein E6I99_03160 [Chloroflexi bacterium]|nr:MAG: hypothetical protein E6I99_03160 [Chloroflexota bacterium]TMD83831.1 MAG: hypothetical protein E6I74_04610 [Chloroflexota bacterium]